MTWKLRKKDSRCASISVTKEQEVWGEYGIYTAHKHKYVFKIIHKRHLKVSKKEVQIPSKSNPKYHLKEKNYSDAARDRKKTILGGRVPHRARQKDAKFDRHTTSRAPKILDLHALPKNMNCGVSLEATETLLENT